MYNLSGYRSFLWTAILLLGSTFACNRSAEPVPPAPQPVQPAVDTTAAIVLQVSQCARLYTTEYHIHKIVTFSDQPVLKGKVLGIPVEMNTRIGDRKIAIPIDVTLKGAIDFAHFDARQVERTDSSIVLTLPPPQITATATRVDHQGTRQFIDLTRSRYTDREIAELTRQGTEQVLSHLSQYGIIEQTRSSAARVLSPILQKMGYREDQIVIRFGREYTDQELIRMVQKS